MLELIGLLVQAGQFLIFLLYLFDVVLCFVELPAVTRCLGFLHGSSGTLDLPVDHLLRVLNHEACGFHMIYDHLQVFLCSAWEIAAAAAQACRQQQ